MSNEPKVTMNDLSVDIRLGRLLIMFYKPTVMNTDEVEVVIIGEGNHEYDTVNSKILIGALKALEAGHEKRKILQEGRDRWESSMQQRQ